MILHNLRNFIHIMPAQDYIVKGGSTHPKKFKSTIKKLGAPELSDLHMIVKGQNFAQQTAGLYHICVEAIPENATLTSHPPLKKRFLKVVKAICRIQKRYANLFIGIMIGATALKSPRSHQN